MNTVPTIGPRYWAALCLASIFGADCGDYAAHALGLGHWRGLPVLAVLFALTFRAARRGRSEAWYWAAIIIVRTAATNLADLQAHDIHLPAAILMFGYAALLAALAGSGRVGPRPAHADPRFWAGMLLAGTLGTVAGDEWSHLLSHGPAGASAAMSVALAAAFLAMPAWRTTAPVASFWLLVVLVRTWGTDVGDWLAATIGLAGDLLASGTAFVALLLCWPTPRAAPTTSASAALAQP